MNVIILYTFWDLKEREKEKNSCKHLKAVKAKSYKLCLFHVGMEKWLAQAIREFVRHKT